MLIKKFLIIGICLLSLVGIGNSPCCPSPVDIDIVVEEALEKYQVPGAAVGVIVDGHVVLAKGYGLRNVEQNLPATENTLFAIGSCTKAFTTFVLGTLVDEGRISWDDPVKKHIPEFSLWDLHATEKITIRDLITHQSGLSHHDDLWYNWNLSREEILHQLQYLEPEYDLGEKFCYNNLMYCVAGIVIERVTGQSWEENVQKRIFTPLGMNHSGFLGQTSLQREDISLPYCDREGKIVQVPFLDLTNVGPAGSIHSNLDDMLVWIQTQFFENRLIRSETLQEIQTLQISNYGLGWFVDTYEGHKYLSHSGSIDGFSSRVSFFPKEKVGVVVLTNNSESGADFVSSVTNQLFEKIDFFRN